jgi:hypothetical protein
MSLVGAFPFVAQGVLDQGGGKLRPIGVKLSKAELVSQQTKENFCEKIKGGRTSLFSLTGVER